MKKQDDQNAQKIPDQVDWEAKYLRALADYQNLERRHTEEKQEVRAFANEVLLVRFLAAIDTLSRAKDHLKDAGLDLAYKEFMAVLEEQGVEKIKTVGREFNPHEMECIEVVDGQDNIVIEELLPGFRFNEKVLRVAHVKVGKRKI